MPIQQPVSVTGGARDGGRRPSWLWTFFIVLAVTGSLVAVGFAWVQVHRSRTLVGEGELFRTQIRSIVARLDVESVDQSTFVRQVRNELEIEAVSLVDEEGVVQASTSATLSGFRIDNPILGRSIAAAGTQGGDTPVFAAIAAPLGRSIEIDGVPAWKADDVLYHVAHPLPAGGAVLASYDIAELLALRKEATALPSSAVGLVTVAAFLAVMAMGLTIGRSRVERTFRAIAVEAELLGKQTAFLTEHNRQLDAARAEAERALALAEEKNRIRAEFVLMINHELRTPLTGVVSGAELLQEIVPDPVAQGILDDMIAGGRRLMDMIGQILAVARIENRGLFFDVMQTPLRAIVDTLGEQRTGTLLWVDPSVDVDHTTLLTDAATLPQLIAALADNSIDHGAGRVVISCRPSLPFDPMVEVGCRPDQAFYFLVADDGPGIDPDFLPRAFEKFEKRSFNSGTGLGLYMAKMMAEALTASISVSTGPRGTVMAVGVPVVPSMAATV